jgi:hypothetical protein
VGLHLAVSPDALRGNPGERGIGDARWMDGWMDVIDLMHRNPGKMSMFVLPTSFQFMVLKDLGFAF